MIVGTFGSLPVNIVEVTAKGAVIEHFRPLGRGVVSTLRFRWEGDELAVDAEVAKAGASRSTLRWAGVAPRLNAPES